MQLAELLADPPLLHAAADGAPISFAVNNRVLDFISRSIGPGMSTVETGAGLSTIVFAMQQARHTAITDKEDETERIREYCSSHGVDASGVTFLVGDSADVLPVANLSDVELVLIDGRHAFPSPFIDWYYLSRTMTVGGLLIVDDTQLWTGQVLRDFLLEQPGWELEASFPPLSACFRLTARVNHSPEWDSQPFVVARSLPTNAPQATANARPGGLARAISRLRPRQRLHQPTSRSR
jgi:predicted O-methyltransferase YrrM